MALAPRLASAKAEVLRTFIPAWTDDDPVSLGREGQRAIFTASALSNGLASHSGATLGEPYRRQGAFVLDRLMH